MNGAGAGRSRLGRKVLLLVGAGPGMGRTVAQLAAIRGMDVALVARSAAPLEETAELVREAGGDALVFAVDATDRTAMRSVVDGVMARFGRLDVLVHSLLPPHLLERVLGLREEQLDEWRRSVEISTYGALLAGYYCAPAMIGSGGGSMVFVTATSGLQSYASVSAHAVGKAGIHALMQSLASELGTSGIRCNAVAVGVLDGVTSRGSALHHDPQVAADLARAVDGATAALGRNPSEREAAEVALFLASDASSGMTGQIVAVDGGKVFH